MVMFNVDNFKRDVLIVSLVLIWLMFPVYSSWQKWNEHPKRIECDYDFGTCKIIIYKYEHKICWNKLYVGHSHNSQCKLPKSAVEEKEIFKLRNIKDVIVVPVNGLYEIEVVDRSDNTISVAKFKNESSANNISDMMLKNIKKWQYNKQDYYTEDQDETFYYDFLEY